MRRREHDHVASRVQVSGGARHLAVVVPNVFEDVDIKDGVEAIGDAGQRAHQLAMSGANGLDLRGERGVRLKTCISAMRKTHQQARVGANPRAHFEHIAAEEGRDLHAPVALPIHGFFEKRELGAGVFKRRGGGHGSGFSSIGILADSYSMATRAWTFSRAVREAPSSHPRSVNFAMELIPASIRAGREARIHSSRQ